MNIYVYKAPLLILLSSSGRPLAPPFPNACQHDRFTLCLASAAIICSMEYQRMGNIVLIFMKSRVNRCYKLLCGPYMCV